MKSVYWLATRALPFGADLHSPRREGSRSAAILEPRGAAAAPAEETPAAPEHHAADGDRGEPDHGRAEEHRPRDREDDLEEDLEAAPHGAGTWPTLALALA